MEENELDPEPVVIPYAPFPVFLRWVPDNFEHLTFDRYAEQLASAKTESGPDVLRSAVSIATKWAAVNTGAIENLYDVDRGFTYSVAVSGAAWSNIHKLKGDSAAHAMADAINAYDYVLDATTKDRPVTEHWIKELHAIVCASQESFTVLTAVGTQERSLPLGTYKTDPNSPLNLATNEVHSYAPPMDTGPEMARLIEQLRSDEFIAAHPILQAAYAHYAFVCIHPFADGNGRVSRALASTYLYRNPGVPLVIFADQKGEYLDALEAADAGNSSAFVHFVSERAIDTVGMVKAQMTKIEAPEINDQMSAMAPVLTGMGGLQHLEIDAIAERLVGVFHDAVNAQIARYPLTAPFHSQAHRVGGGGGKTPAGYRNVPTNKTSVSLMVSSSAPATAMENRHYGCVIARPGTEGADFLIRGLGRTLVEVAIREMHPTVGAALVYRCEMAALGELRESVEMVGQKATKALRDQGYLA
ncbi:Fic family protein [Cryobacterium arcticum]|uniref:Fido domain-containing protein n=1 Tax=Cryobacterium arcticum TaxID=670052 RepID=A0A317ZRU7_9MICO|nr:Fic family protein [Cryobacterium arcticum]PXA67484.1 hypothetical protein CTB96_12220 [Cryobacterium arcticum]